jgi:predicted nucleotidyltransferase
MNIALMVELVGGLGRFKALQCLYEQPDRAFGTRELALEAGIDPGNASRWLRRWSDVGLVERHKERGSFVFKASGDPALAPLAALMQQASRAADVLRNRVNAIGGHIEAAAIFGSAARGTAGRDSDIDLLLITEMPQLKAQALFKSAGRELGRPVNVLVFTSHEWRKAVESGDTFVGEILRQPMIGLKGPLNAPAPA